MHQIQINVGQHEQRQRLLQLVDRGFPPVALLAPELGRDENLFSWNAAVFYGPTNAAFVAVYLRSVDVAVAHLESIQASLICLVAVSSLIHTETHGGDCMTAVEGESIPSSGAGHGA